MVDGWWIAGLASRNGWDLDGGKCGKIVWENSVE